MSQDKQQTRKQLSELWAHEKIPVLEIGKKNYFIFSDFHLGDGGGADDFHKNEEAFLTALDFYFAKGYSLIMLGDIEEFWQFDLDKIVERYDETVYAKIKEFGNDKVFRVFGNHDREWGPLDDPVQKPSMSRGAVNEALKMKLLNQDKPSVLLVHGHQGSIESDKTSWISRFFVRVFKRIEPITDFLGLTEYPDATKSQIVKDYERIFYSWAKDNDAIVICGHSHRAIFASRSRVEELDDKRRELQVELQSSRSKKERKKILKELDKLLRQKTKEMQKNRDIDPLEPEGEAKAHYFNTGCGLYRDGITGLEIEGDQIRLVKWHRDVSVKPHFEHFQKGNLKNFIQEIS